MNIKGLLITSIILQGISLKTIITKLAMINNFQVGMFIHPYNYNLRKVLLSIDDIDTSEDQVYSVEYVIYVDKLFVYLYKNIVMIELCTYNKQPLNEVMKELLKSFIMLSEATLVGYETSLFIESYPDSLNKTLNDKSLYPLFFYEKKCVQSELIFKVLALKNTPYDLINGIKEFISELLEGVKFSEATF